MNDIELNELCLKALEVENRLRITRDAFDFAEQSLTDFGQICSKIAIAPPRDDEPEMKRVILESMVYMYKNDISRCVSQLRAALCEINLAFAPYAIPLMKSSLE